MLENAGGGFEHVALVDILDSLCHDGRTDPGHRELAKGGIDIAFEGAGRLGVSPPLHSFRFIASHSWATVLNVVRSRCGCARFSLRSVTGELFVRAAELSPRPA